MIALSFMNDAKLIYPLSHQREREGVRVAIIIVARPLTLHSLPEGRGL
jgi:hypothetical protein